MSELLQHPLGKLIPPASEDDFCALKESIRAHGFNRDHPVVILDGMVLDGWSRELAVRELDVKAEYVHFIAPDMAETPLDYVIQENLSRRHLSVSQRAAIAAELMERSLDPDAEEKPQGEAPESADEPASEPLTVPKAAAIMHVSESSVKRARKKKKEGKSDEQKTKERTEKRQENIRTATKIIEDTLGEGWVKQSKISSSDTIQLSGVIPEEMKRIEPFLRAGWKLAAALGHKSVSLTHAHSIRDLLNRAIEFGKFTLDIEDWTVSVTKREE